MWSLGYWGVNSETDLSGSVSSFFGGDTTAEKEQPKLEQRDEPEQPKPEQRDEPRQDTKKTKRKPGHTIPAQMV
jgi:hypothetical protein